MHVGSLLRGVGAAGAAIAGAHKRKIYLGKKQRWAKPRSPIFDSRSIYYIILGSFIYKGLRLAWALYPIYDAVNSGMDLRHRLPPVALAVADHFGAAGALV